MVVALIIISIMAYIACGLTTCRIIHRINSYDFDEGSHSAVEWRCVHILTFSGKSCACKGFKPGVQAA